MRAARRFTLPLLLALAIASLGADCTDWESLRRRSEGISGTPAGEQLVADRIAALVGRMGGAVQFDGADASLADRMAFYDVPGLTVAVLHDGVIEWVAGFGTRGEDVPEALPPYALFQGASLSKVVTAVAALRAVEAGLLGLDAPLNDALTSWTLPDNELTAVAPATLRGALSHTAGINVPSFFGYLASSALPTTLETLDGLAGALNPPIRVTQTPGSVWSYSGGGLMVVQQALEDVTGSYRDWVREQVFAPAGMWGSGFHQPAPAVMGGFIAIGSDLFEPRTYPELAAAGVWTNALDLARLVDGLQRSFTGQPGALLSQPTAQAMMTAQTPAPPFAAIGLDPSPGMGLGVFLVNQSLPRFFWHTGENLGYTSVIVGSLERGDGIAIMTNGQRFFFGGGRVLAWEIVDAIAHIYDWGNWGGWGH